jgi:hypothetical protein
MNRPHQWIVFATYGMTDAEAAALHNGAEQRLDAEHRVSVDGPACMNCERVWSPELAERPCPAPRYDIEPNADARVRQT